MESIKVFAPASVSNVGPGFDIMGFALNEPGDEIILRKSKTDTIEIAKITGDGGKLPIDPKKNTVTVGIKALLNSLNIKAGLKVEIRKKMGFGSGLGSSAASAVGGVFAANELLGLNLSKDELLKPAMHGEYIASKAMHADNVAPALYGGFILIRCYNPIDIIKVPIKANLYCSIIYPDIEVKTSEARKLVKKSVRIHSAISQAGNSASLITALLTKDYKLLSRSIVDSLAEPYRARLVKGYDQIRAAALYAGALNCNITGSGPSMFAFSRSKTKAEEIVKSMKKASSKFTKKNTTYISRINMTGPKILD
jgi:homoserine kinase